MELEEKIVNLRTQVRQAQEEIARREVKRDEARARLEEAIERLREAGVRGPEEAMSRADELDAEAAVLVEEYERRLAESQPRKAEG